MDEIIIIIIIITIIIIAKIMIIIMIIIIMILIIFFFHSKLSFRLFQNNTLTYTIKTLKYISLSKEKHIFLAVLIQKKKLRLLKLVKF